MRLFLYDKSFTGLLCVLFDAYARKAFPDMLLGQDDIAPLTITSVHRVRTDPGRAARVFAGLRGKLSPEGLRDVLYAWLSEQPRSDLLLARHMRGVFDGRPGIERDYGNPDALAVRTLAEKVACERHRLMGFVRFQKTAENIYFAPIAPRYDVLPLLPRYFADRLADQDWILYDTIRRYGIAFEQGAFRDVRPDGNALRAGKLDPAALADDEDLFQRLWKTYFAATAIRERTNPRLQARCLPRRFWPYLTEKQPPIP